MSTCPSPTESTTSHPVGIHELHLEVGIEASPAEVWEALTTDIGAWWPRSFHIGGEGSTFQLEAQPGGRVFEPWGEGAGLLWGTVNTVEPEKQLRFVSDNFPDYGGPARTYLTWHIEVEGETTFVRFSESLLGAPGPEQLDSMKTGWRFLLDCLGAHLEGRPEPQGV